MSRVVMNPSPLNAADLLAPLQGLGADEMIAEVEASGLGGKGGGGFPTHRKLRLMRLQPAVGKILVVNGSEHEPGSLKDRHLLEHFPQRVLAGAILAARSVGAERIIFAVNQHATAALAGIRQEIEVWQRDADRQLIEVTVQTVPDVYIVGEETALISVLEGGEAKPRRKPPLSIESGLHGLPTLVQNVETVAHLPFIASEGAEAYKALGNGADGVTLCTLGTEFARPGVYEVRLGTPIREILFELGGGLADGSEIRAIQPGGPSTGFIEAADFDTPFDAASLAAKGSSLGCAVVRAYSRSEDMVRAIGRLLTFFRDASCGQCPECRMETQMLVAIFQQLVSGRGSCALLERIKDILEVARDKGICGFIRMPVAPVESGLRLFSADFDVLIYATKSA